MRAIILAAGEGSRMGKLTQNIPKPLLDINGKSIIERQLSS
ncbi:MAG TPA: CTP--phosphocholine cytidylyltransferase, partial [Candidatus Nitrosopelagicus sp.]|nr:CTP--phosphocholine cytidylyltransferase [Candidatus Nitrosopelagicus sp.]